MIGRISPQNQNVNFNARLFNSEGRQVKAFNLLDQLNNVDKVTRMGSPATDVFVKEIISTKNVYGAYYNEIDFEIRNPLFGKQRMTYDLRHETNSPVEQDDIWHLELLTSKSQKLEYIEDRALANSLIEEAKDNANSMYAEEIDPVKILENRLETIDKAEHGFDEKRIDKFRKIAERLHNDMLKVGAKNIKKY